MTECILAADEELASDVIPDPPSPDNSEAEEEPSDPSSGPAVWIVAQSNVAVKNVAEKLVKVGIRQFKLIVSREFHFEWQVLAAKVNQMINLRSYRHEHVYTKVKENMVVTSSLPKNAAEVRTFLGDSRVVLCTLSMVTHPILKNLEFYKYMPVNNVVVDEGAGFFLGYFVNVFLNSFPPQRHRFNSEIFFHSCIYMGLTSRDFVSLEITTSVSHI
jgi:hypothetical protein